MHRFLLHNGRIRDASEWLLSPGQIGYLNGWGVFSTVRVTGGVLFAWERHYRRMQTDAKRMRVPFELSLESLEEELSRLIEANDALEATLRVCIIRNTGGMFESPGLTHPTDLVAFTAGLRDWGAGVKLTYVPNARHGAAPFSGAKVTSWAHNLTWYEQARETGFDEVVLLNEEGNISECTSANIFALQGDRLLTPPLSTSGCLPGVTRAILLEEIRIPGLVTYEAELSPSDLEEADGVFITSTTRDLLPVFEIDGACLRQAPERITALRRCLQDYRVSYIAERRRLRTPQAI